jgi:hypothetical protein
MRTPNAAGPQGHARYPGKPLDNITILKEVLLVIELGNELRKNL